MAYITTQQFKDSFGTKEFDQLADKDQTGVEDIDGFYIAEATANGLVNDACMGRYVIPFATVPSVITQLVLDITRYYWYDDAPTETVIARYKYALEMLEDIKNGKLTLDDAELLATDRPKGAAIAKGSTIVFSDDLLSKRIL